MADHESILKRYAQASAEDDMDMMGTFRHPNWRMTWPQSGEIVVGHENYVVTRMNRPEGTPPRVTPLRMGGAGDVWWSEARVEYADGSVWLATAITEFEGDKIIRERVYFAQPFPAPAWRAPLVEREPPAVG